MNTETSVQELLERGQNPLQIAKHCKSTGKTADETMKILGDAGICVEREDAGWGIVLHIPVKPSLGHGNELDTLAGATRELAWRNN